MPVISTIIGLGIAAASAGSGIAGAVSAHGSEQAQKKALSQQEQIAQQEMTDKQAIFKQLSDFFTPYLKTGSPYLEKTQAATAGQEAQQGNNAAGQFREQMNQTGAGFGPSGSTAAGLAGIGEGQAQSSAANYLQNLLNNEQVKFQAASGLQGAGSMVGSPQNQPNVSTTLPPANFASSIGAFGNVLQNLGKGAPTPQQIPQSVPGGQMGDILLGMPGTQGTTP